MHQFCTLLPLPFWTVNIYHFKHTMGNYLDKQQQRRTVRGPRSAQDLVVVRTFVEAGR